MTSLLEILRSRVSRRVSLSSYTDFDLKEPLNFSTTINSTVYRSKQHETSFIETYPNSFSLRSLSPPGSMGHSVLIQCVFVSVYVRPLGRKDIVSYRGGVFVPRENKTRERKEKSIYPKLSLLSVHPPTGSPKQLTYFD